jgi:hypothetical protein
MTSILNYTIYVSQNLDSLNKNSLKDQQNVFIDDELEKLELEYEEINRES